PATLLHAQRGTADASNTMPSPVELALISLLPTTSPIPSELIELSNSLVAQSRSRASSMKPEEEIGRTYTCCHIACERLGKKLSLELGKPSPPVKPALYKKLKTYLSSALRTPAATPRRATRTEDKVGSAVGTPTGEKSSAAATPSSVGRRGLRSADATPKQSVQATTPTSGRKRKVDEVDESTTRTATDLPGFPEDPTADAGEGDDTDVGKELIPANRPAKTPLRRKEKHTKRNVDDLEDLGPAGLLPGLGTMFQPALDWLGDERHAEYIAWKKDMMAEIAAIERGQADA
ncbi:hypothetical protein KC343_g12394, partial [Hortaea werneckii]